MSRCASGILNPDADPGLNVKKKKSCCENDVYNFSSYMKGKLWLKFAPKVLCLCQTPEIVNPNFRSLSRVHVWKQHVQEYTHSMKSITFCITQGATANRRWKQKKEKRQKKQNWGKEQHTTLGIMGVTCNYFIALKIPELLVSVYRARARQGHKLQPLALAPNAQ